jgi:N-acyl-D-aspartate/D-glutamate deacylase
LTVRAAHDLVFRQALLVDGSGAPPREGDLAVSDGLIAAVGTVSGRGAEEIDARGLALSPGFIDAHTHLDANLFWDPDLTPSSSFGVTTVVTGNCGYTLAPIEPGGLAYVLDAMSFVEQIPLETLNAGVPLDWSDLDSYFARLEALPALLNHATLIGHVPIRTAILGSDAAHERAADASEIERMVRLLRRGLELGALGFSTDQVIGNFGPGMGKLPGQVCGRDELVAFARALGEAPGPGLFAMAPAALLQGRAERYADQAWHEELAAASGRAVVVGPCFDDVENSGIGCDVMDLVLAGRRPGVRVVPQVAARAFELWTRLDRPGVLARCLPTLHRAVGSGGAAGVRALAADARARERLRIEADAMPKSPVFAGRWDHVFVRYAARAEHAPLVGLDLLRIGAERCVHPVDALLDLALAEDFETQFATAMRNADEAEVGRLLAHPAAMIGASDAGAHVLSNTDSCFAVWTLQRWVRERSVLSLERAVQMLTADQADLLGFADRGRLAPGLAADLVLFDPDRIATTAVRYVADQPAGGSRLVTDAIGVHLSVVNGVVATREGKSTGARPGRFLRPGVAASL